MSAARSAWWKRFTTDMVKNLCERQDRKERCLLDKSWASRMFTPVNESGGAPTAQRLVNYISMEQFFEDQM